MPHFGGVLFGMYVMYPYIYIYIYLNTYIYIYTYVFPFRNPDDRGLPPNKPIAHGANPGVKSTRLVLSAIAVEDTAPLPTKAANLCRFQSSLRPGLDRWNISETISSTTGATGATGTTGDTGVLPVLLSITTISDHTICSGGTVAEHTILPTQGPLVP